MGIDSDINDNTLNTILLHGLFVLGMHMLIFDVHVFIFTWYFRHYILCQRV